MFSELEEIIAKRQEESAPGSYTKKLLTEGSLAERKVHEEAYEVIEAALKGERSSLLYEACDLLYHLLVLLRKYDISLSEIEDELRRRRG